jgi:membrane associated rhomboid family serine protease
LITTVRIPALVFLGIWFVMQSFNGLISLGAPSATGGTAWWAHIGGFAFGIVIGAIFRAMPAPRSPYANRWYSNR